MNTCTIMQTFINRFRAGISGGKMRDEELGQFIYGTLWDFQKRHRINCSGTERG
jgi:hypothetical protein